MPNVPRSSGRVVKLTLVPLPRDDTLRDGRSDPSAPAAPPRTAATTHRSRGSACGSGSPTAAPPATGCPPRARCAAASAAPPDRAPTPRTAAPLRCASSRPRGRSSSCPTRAPSSAARRCATSARATRCAPSSKAWPQRSRRRGSPTKHLGELREAEELFRRAIEDAPPGPLDWTARGRLGAGQRPVPRGGPGRRRQRAAAAHDRRPRQVLPAAPDVGRAPGRFTADGRERRAARRDPRGDRGARSGRGAGGDA